MTADTSSEIVGRPAAAPPLFPLRVHDLKQFEYCPRIVFYNTVLPVDRKETVKMVRGREVELRLDALESRRSLRRYHLSEGERRYRVWLSSARRALSGTLDMLIRTPGADYPVDFKYTRGRPHRNHVVQLAAYATLVEDALGQPAHTGFIYLVPNNAVVAVRITDGLKALVAQRLTEIRAMIGEQILPPMTSVRARCDDCEFRNYCGDVF
jgi:CRISPR-associated exonuclease Cas4